MRIRRGNAFSVFVIVLVLFTILTVGLGSGGLADLLKGIIPQQTSEVSESGKGEVRFEVSPVNFAKYWKTGSYDLYKSGYWVRTYESPPEKYSGGTIDTGVKTFLTARGYNLQVKVSSEMSVIPTMLNTMRVELDQPASVELTLDDHGIIKTSQGFKGTFRITYLDYSYSKEMLGRTNITVPPSVYRYLSLSNVTPEVIGLAGNLTKDIRTPFERMMYLATYMRHSYGFALNFSQPVGKDPISYFLMEGRRGGLKEFAGGLALMGRAVGIPTRLVSGFVLGDMKDSTRVVTQEDAHFWVEGYFGDLGWIPFEACPGLGSLAKVDGHDNAVRGGGNGGPRMRSGSTPPDLAPSPPYSMPDGLYPNTPFKILLPVSNHGERVVNWFEVGMFFDYETKIIRVDTVLYPQEEAMVPLEITLARSGPQSCDIKLDPYGKQEESDKGNNDVLVTFDVVSGIDLKVSIDRASVNNGKRAFNETIDAIVRVDNIGDVPAYLVTVYVKYGASFTYYFNITAVMGNSYQTGLITLPALPQGLQALVALVDPFNTITELNETNNQDLVPMQVVPRFEITLISWLDETGDAEFGPGDILKVVVQSNVSPSRTSRIIVREADPGGKLEQYVTIPGGQQSAISLLIDHAIADLADATVVIIEV